MTAARMHDDEVDTDASLVTRLIARQFPRWAGLPVEAVPSAGTDNALYRLGAELVVRLPRIHWAVGQVEKEQEWLPKLAPYLPLRIPVPVARGEPAEGYPWHWSVYRWLEGENAAIESMPDPEQAAHDLADFILALQRIDARAGPVPGPFNAQRGEALVHRDRETRECIDRLQNEFEADALTAIWEAALQAPAWTAAPVWLHGDLQSGNLLAVQGRLSAVIDFGCLGVGDPAYDVMAAWLYLNAGTREAFRQALQVDEATWTRGRGLALLVSVVALPYYQVTNPALAGISRRAIREALLDFRANG